MIDDDDEDFEPHILIQVYANDTDYKTNALYTTSLQEALDLYEVMIKAARSHLNE